MHTFDLKSQFDEGAMHVGECVAPENKEVFGDTTTTTFDFLCTLWLCGGAVLCLTERNDQCTDLL